MNSIISKTLLPVAMIILLTAFQSSYAIDSVTFKSWKLTDFRSINANIISAETEAIENSKNAFLYF
jgi:hypothetical protein